MPQFTFFQLASTSALSIADGVQFDDISPQFKCMVYIGRPSDPRFLPCPRQRDPKKVAEIISVSCGERGKNSE
ncbi:uncharacterized protein BDW43DRAFT_264624 [Aspergillus alliaceus]|uniref:uncharacterized protein n=1 Tax=Petromyces alliaceus TaxID=209559 RepID=UPI0012A70DBF|nr:uncharacterized protein BDW43DRAFT_264624 [Aspergillus alliaceus]KAB8237099.1 hypothetical protein BDW43DRAFT_264624 [Aspergillus alliaceus]